ncbi:MAG: aldo/keto reductase, partial [Planctomycetota bacterium]
MATSKLRWGILSTGNIAKTFAKGVAGAARGTLAGVASRDPAKAEAFAKEFGVANAFESYDAMLASPDIDAVYIATPHPQHAEWTIKACRAGKHVLCEKPLGVNWPEAMAMADAADEAGVVLMEAFMYRCHPQTKAIYDAIAAGKIGDVQVIDVSFSFRMDGNPESRLLKNALAGGGILDVGCYATSFARLIAGAATGKPVAEPSEVSGSAHLGKTGVDEWAIASLKFDGPGDTAILAQLRTGVRLNADNTAIVHGTEGTLTVPMFYRPDGWGEENDTGVFTITRDGKTETVETPSEKSCYAYEADAFAEAVEHGIAQHPAMTPADTLGNMRTLDRWRRAIGLTYEQEKLAGFLVTTLTRETLAKAAGAPMEYGNVDGLAKPVSKLIMGVDNQGNLPTAAAMFDDYFQRGGNTFDTAVVYGRGNSQAFGEWMKLRGVRDECVFISKGAHTPNNVPAAVRRELMMQLDWIGTDHCDVYFLHRDNPDVPAGEFVDVLAELQSEGLIRGPFGGSNWSVARAKEAMAYAEKSGKPGFGAMSNNLSLAVMNDPVWGGCVCAHDDDYLAWHEQTQVANFSWSSQARGFFVPDRDLKED